MTQFFFNRNTIDNLKFYVYGLKDPFTNKYFYIGKGNDSRINKLMERNIDENNLKYYYLRRDGKVYI